MSTVLLDGRPCPRAELHVPWEGRWTIELALDAPLPSGLVTVTWGDAELVGTVDDARSGLWQEEARVRVEGGPGWATEVDPQWLQNDAGLSGQAVASQLAGLVSESLTGPTGGAPTPSLFRPLRVSYARTRTEAAVILKDCLAPGATWWIEFDGSTRVGARPAPSAPARVELLELDPVWGWAELDADDPSQILVGSVLDAAPPRRPEARRIVELWAWSGPDGQRFRASTGAAPAGSGRLAAAFAALARAAAPELPFTSVRRARVLSQGVDFRVSLQHVDRAGEQPDTKPVNLYPGVPGTSARVPAGSEVVLAYSRADASDPLAFLAAPKGFPNHVPYGVYHEAATEIRFVASSNGNVFVGDAPQAVACAPFLQTYLQKLEAWALQLDLALNAAFAAIPFVPPLSYLSAVEDRIAAAGYTPPAEAASFSAIVSLRLFAQADHNEPLPGPGGGE